MKKPHKSRTVPVRPELLVGVTGGKCVKCPDTSAEAKGNVDMWPA